MSKLRPFVLLMAFVQVPAVARADGFIDWWEKWSGPKIMAVGYDYHVFCATTSGRQGPGCEVAEFSRGDLRAADLEHIVDARIAFGWKYGERFSDVIDTRSVTAAKLMGLYHRRVVQWLDLGAGAGYIRVSGKDFPEPLSRLILTPLSLYISPFEAGRPWSLIKIRFEASFITKGFNGDQFGNKATYFDTYGGEWSNSVGIGFDLLRLRR